MAIGFKSISLSNFRSIDRLDGFEPDADITWLMGKNGAGKSNLLDAIAFPGDLLRGGRAALSAQWRGRPTASEELELSSLLLNPGAPASWDFTFEDADAGVWRYRLTLMSVRQSWRVEEELLERIEPTGPRPVLVNGLSGARLGMADGRWQPIASTLQSLVLAHAAHLEGALAAPALRFLQGVWLFHPDPLLMRGDPVEYNPELPPDRYGRDLEGLLEHFIGDEPEAVAALLDSVQAVCGWSRLSVVRERGERRVRFAEGSPRELPLALASEGQALAAWLARLAIAPPPSCTVALLDEPAVALSPEVQERVYGWVYDLSDAVQVLAATHDKAAVNRATSRSSVFLIERRPGEASSLTRLDKHAVSEEWSDLFKPGEVAAQAMRLGLREPGA